MPVCRELGLVLVEEHLDLLGYEPEQFLVGIAGHQLLRDGDLGLIEVVGAISTQLDRADAEIRAAEVYG